MEREIPPTESRNLKSNLARHRVLVVDDNVDAAQSLGMLLKLSGQDVVIAHEGDGRGSESTRTSTRAGVA